jgi:hypothetical protein
MLKGLGAALSLPLFEAMAPRGWVGTAHADGATPVRMLFVNQPNGMWMENFTPTIYGPLPATLPATLKSLEPFRADFSILTGLGQANAAAKGDGPGDHARSAGAFLTGAHPRKTAGADIKLGVSVDQVAAKAIGQNSRFPSIELGCDAGKRAGECDSGYSCAYVSNISWSSETTPMPKTVDPKQVFDRLFADAGVDMTARLEQRKSILDFVRDDTARVEKQLGKADQRKLDEFVTSVREVERRIEQNLKTSAKPIKLPPGTQRPTGIPKDYAEHIKLMYDMIALAFQTDVTRIGTFLVANEGSGRNFSFIGANGAHHENSHHGKSAEKIEAIKKIDKFYMDQFAGFIKRMKETKEGNGSLLDNCMVVLGSGIGDGDRHNHDNLPIILAGKGGGSIVPGRHVKYGRGTPLCNLYVGMLQRMGVKDAPKFGDSTQTLPQLS